MNDNAKTTRVNLDGFHSLDITVNESAKTVVAELITGEETTFIYAEKFHLKRAIRESPLLSSAYTNRTSLDR